jgi:hypothetical protein
MLCLSDSQTINSSYAVNCSQFRSDYDVLRQFPFPILINPIDDEWNGSTAIMDDNSTFVLVIYFRAEKVIPSSVYCLSNLKRLQSVGTPLYNGKFPLVAYNFDRKGYFRYSTRCFSKFKTTSRTLYS